MSLRRDNGKTLKVPLAKLSKEDQEYVLAEPKPKADPVSALKKEGVTELEKLGATIIPNAQGEIVIVDFNNTQDKTQVTDAGLVHLKVMTGLRRLDLNDTQATDAGVEDLKKALPQCTISK